MKLKKITFLLKSLTILATLVTALFCFWIIPVAKQIAIEEFPELEALNLTGTICTFILFLLCCHAFFHFYKICQNIDHGNSFCRDNVRHMGMITFMAISLFVFFIICSIILGMNDFLAGPVIVWGTFLEFIVCGIAVVCYALTKLIEHACEIQEENCLTI